MVDQTRFVTTQKSDVTIHKDRSFLLGPRDSPTPIYYLFENTSFNQEQNDLMSAVFERLKIELVLDRKSAEIRDSVVKAILKCAQNGIFDTFEMRRCAYELLDMA